MMGRNKDSGRFHGTKGSGQGSLMGGESAQKQEENIRRVEGKPVTLLLIPKKKKEPTLSQGYLTKRKLLKNMKNKRLKNVIDQLYRDDAHKGDGGTAAALRYEKKSGKLLSPRGHQQKAEERMQNLDNIMKHEKLSLEEKVLAQSLYNDLEDAVKMKGK
jgi:hypothetical protein